MTNLANVRMRCLQETLLIQGTTRYLLCRKRSISISPSCCDVGAKYVKVPRLVVIGLDLVNVSHFRFLAPARQLALIKLASISHDQFSFQHVSASE